MNRFTTTLFGSLLYTLVFSFSFEGEGTKNNPYVIYTSDDLMELADSVNNGHDCNSQYFIQSADIDAKLSDRTNDNWTPIGSSKFKFEGHYDGTRHTIENVAIRGTKWNENAIFGCIGANGVVERLNIKNLKLTKTSLYGGSICAVNDGIISKCNVEGIDINANYLSGGIAGSNFGLIEQCTTNGYVNGTVSVGGITGYNYGEITECKNNCILLGALGTGGITGYNGGFDNSLYCKDMKDITPCMIANCINNGNITSEKYSGGISGRNDGNIEYCQNNGVVISDWYAGGITGANGNANNIESKIEICCNTGLVYTNEEYAGGICGHNLSNGTIEKVVNNVLFSFENTTANTSNLVYANDGTILKGYWLKNDNNDVFINNGQLSETSCFDSQNIMCNDGMEYEEVDEIIKSSNYNSNVETNHRENQQYKSLYVVGLNKCLYVFSLEPQETTIYDVKGTIINTIKIQGGEYKVIKIPSGIYFVNSMKVVVR